MQEYLLMNLKIMCCCTIIASNSKFSRDTRPVTVKQRMDSAHSVANVCRIDVLGLIYALNKIFA